MDVDAQTGHVGAASKDEELELASLARLEAVANSPYNAELHLDNIAHSTSAQAKEEARQFMASVLLLPEEIWMSWIDDRKQSVTSAADVDGALAVIELYQRSMADMLSIKLRCDYANYIVGLYYGARGLPHSISGNEAVGTQQSTTSDEQAQNAFDIDFVREQLALAVDPLVRTHLVQGQLAWKILHDFEADCLARGGSSNDQLKQMQQCYLQRLAEPHTSLADTHQLYSTFISTHLSDAYESTMVAAQKVYNASQSIVNQRDSYESQLEKSANAVDAFETYIQWELAVKRPDFALVRSLYERALYIHPTSLSIWEGYLDFMLRAFRKASSFLNIDSLTGDDITNLCSRAVRAMPSSGSCAASCIRALESMGDGEAAMAFSQAQFGRFVDTSITTDYEEVVQVATAYADMLRHPLVDETYLYAPTEEIVNALQSAIDRVNAISPETGDPQLRLEKYLLRMYERCDSYDAVNAALAAMSQRHPKSAAVLILRADYFVKQNLIEEARKLYNLAGKKRFDYPEYLYDAWLAFEHREGSLNTLEKAMTTVKHEMTFVRARRQKDIERAWLQAQEKVPTSSAATTIATDLGATVGAEVAEEVSAIDPGTASKKRRASSRDVATEESEAVEKKAKLEHRAIAEGTSDVKRDRENSTVFIGGLATSADEAAIRRIFRDCGPIRELTLRSFGDTAAATVEFVDKDQVAGALTKDKKRIDEQEIKVYPNWKSILFVTNFPETFDDAQLRDLFQVVFDTRWPSKRLNTRRRFAYLQYTTPEAALTALSLNGLEIEPGSGRRLQVKLSDPSRKQNRSDFDAKKCELYITGLPKRIKDAEADLRKIFASFGPIKGVRAPKESDGNYKGFAFVEFEEADSAKEALSMNNTEYKKRRLAVVLADSRVTQKAKTSDTGQSKQSDTRSRSLRVKGLPLNAQEAILQQIFSAYGEVEAVLIDGDQATVTFHVASDVGKLLLEAPKVLMGETELSIESPIRNGPGQSGNVGDRNRPNGAQAAFMPRVSKRGRGARLGIGHSRTLHSGGQSDAGVGIGAAATQDSITSTVDAERTGEPAEVMGAAAGVKSQDDFRDMLLSKKPVVR